jgi:hypothetical protein
MPLLAESAAGYESVPTYVIHRVRIDHHHSRVGSAPCRPAYPDHRCAKVSRSSRLSYHELCGQGMEGCTSRAYSSHPEYEWTGANAYWNAVAEVNASTH